MKIALIEEPKSCASCPLFDVGYAFDMCRLSKKQVTTAESINIPKWCELKPIPNKACQMLVDGLDAMEKMKSVEVRVVRRTE